MSRDYADKKICAAKAIKSLPTIVGEAPTEFAVRPLTKLRTPEGERKRFPRRTSPRGRDPRN